MKRVLVTGASGFVGRHLIRALAASGYSVVAAVRESSSLDHDSGIRDVRMIGDLSTTDWDQAVHGTQLVVHLAARVHKPNDYDESAYQRENVQSTIRLAEACKRAGVSRMVFISSVGCVTEGSTDPYRIYTESDACTPRTPYGRSKRDAELALEKIARTGQLKVTVLRPPMVYGPGLKGNLVPLLAALDRGLPLPLASVRNRRSFIYVGNLADAIVKSFEEGTGRQAFEIFFVSDDEPISTPNLIMRLTKLLGKSPRLFPFPVSLLKLAAKLIGKEQLMVSLTGNLVVDISAIRRALSWKPVYSINEGLAATVEWYRQKHPVRC